MMGREMVGYDDIHPQYLIGIQHRDRLLVRNDTFARDLPIDLVRIRVKVGHELVVWRSWIEAGCRPDTLNSSVSGRTCAVSGFRSCGFIDLQDCG